MNFSDLTIWSEVLSIHSEMWNILDKKLHRPENKFKYTDDVDMRRDQTFKLLSVSLLPDQARLWIEKNYLDATTNKQEQQAFEAEHPHSVASKNNRSPSESTTSKPKYREDNVSVLIIEHIFPQLSVDRTTKFTQKFALECWNAQGLQEFIQSLENRFPQKWKDWPTE